MRDVIDQRDGRVGGFIVNETHKQNYDKDYHHQTTQTIRGNVMSTYDHKSGKLLSERKIGKHDSYSFDEDGNVVANQPQQSYMSSYDRTANTTSTEAMWITALLGAFVGGFFIHSIWHFSVIWCLIIGAIASPLLLLAILVIIPLLLGSVGGALIGALIGVMGHENVSMWSSWGAIIGFICGGIYLWKLKNEF